MVNVREQFQQRAESSRIPVCPGTIQDVTRQMIVDEALTWEGTPFHHQESTKTAGCDCKGLVYGVSKVLGLDVLAGHLADVAVMVRLAGYPQVAKQLGDRILGHAGHAHGRPDAIAFDQGRNYPDSLLP